MYSRRFQDVFKTSSRHVLKTSWRPTNVCWVDTHTNQLKNFQRSNNRLFEYNVTFLIWSHHISAFAAGNLALTFFVRLQFLPWFSFFCKFQCHFHKNAFVLTFIIGIFYLILVWSGLKAMTFFKKLFFCPPPTNLQYKIINSCNYI